MPMSLSYEDQRSAFVEKVLAPHVITIAYEVEVEYDECVSDNVEYDYWDLLDADPWVEFHYNEDDPEESFILVGGSIEGERTYQTSSARYNPPGKAYPAEYDTEPVEIGVDIAFYPMWGGGMGGAEIQVLQI